MEGSSKLITPQRNLQGDFYIMENGEKGGRSAANLIVSFLEEARDQYEQVKNFFGCNARMIDNM